MFYFILAVPTVCVLCMCGLTGSCVCCNILDIYGCVIIISGVNSNSKMLTQILHILLFIFSRNQLSRIAVSRKKHSAYVALLHAESSFEMTEKHYKLLNSPNVHHFCSAWCFLSPHPLLFAEFVSATAIKLFMREERKLLFVLQHRLLMAVHMETLD